MGSPTSVEDRLLITDLNGDIEYVNEAFVQTTGYDKDEVIGKNPRILQSGKTAPEIYVAMWDALGTGQPWHGEMINRRKDGSEYIEHAIIAPIRQPDGVISNYVAVKEDITDQRKMEVTLRERSSELRELYASLQTARENERHRLARELHDDIGQRITALRMDLDWVEAKLPSALPVLSSKMEKVSSQLDELTDSIRRLIEDMRPGMLDAIGLVAALEDYADKFADRTGVSCELVTGSDDISVSDQIGINIFRIVQEALNNIQKYAQATHVLIRLEQSSDETTLLIQDNGVGLPEISQGGRHGFGVRGMNERVALLNGRFSIVSQPGKGVRIEVVIPT